MSQTFFPLLLRGIYIKVGWIGWMHGWTLLKVHGRSPQPPTPDFIRSVKPIARRGGGADYSNCITTSRPPPDFQIFLRPCKSPSLLEAAEAPAVRLGGQCLFHNWLWDFCWIEGFLKFYALLLNEGRPRAYRGKNILKFPSKSEGITCRLWWKYLQKVNAKRPQFFDEK